MQTCISTGRLKQNLTPKYAQKHIKTANTSEAAKRTETKVRTLRITIIKVV
jgi:hypothetical protein